MLWICPFWEGIAVSGYQITGGGRFSAFFHAALAFMPALFVLFP
jgi:hypothetical protein